MKTIAVCLGLTMALSAGAADEARAVLVGQRLVANGAEAPILVCRYRAAAVNYEVVAASTSCAPYFPLSSPAEPALAASR
jgi:hypothetical protein